MCIQQKSEPHYCVPLTTTEQLRYDPSGKPNVSVLALEFQDKRDRQAHFVLLNISSPAIHRAMFYIKETRFSS